MDANWRNVSFMLVEGRVHNGEVEFRTNELRGFVVELGSESFVITSSDGTTATFKTRRQKEAGDVQVL